ncbi:hypothetical protein QKU48_gp0482 [Fadolivirus algeromassiliense]|jgi:hypothetical protein|uniref:Uncharacterized protein n=1 Tax=Fadolivirus FV1/VV64 TaxID=3070911 RepID=A0A7D3QWX9_9VIRU|nr:hypothetical protein QKU48_gp0482 [Fadolivirus algeromassiliense]QKF93940.1 hypothetical protein Fadolivirus_1_482 [Fadolivirus FV1/VV64]
MDKISINNLFPSTSSDFQPLDVNTLYNPQENKIKNKINFNIDRLIKLREERKQKIFVQYEKIFNMCLNKINLANNLNKTEIIYEVPEAAYGYFDYSSQDCLNYIEERLKNMDLDTLLLDPKTIYVSWLNLEENKKRLKEKIITEKLNQHKD